MRIFTMATIEPTLLLTLLLPFISANALFAQQNDQVDTTSIVERLMENDADSDGKLTRDELPERMSRMFDRTDKDKDGFVTKSELETALKGRLSGSSRGRNRGGGERGERGDRGRGPGGMRGPGGPGGPGGPPPRDPAEMLRMLPIIQALDLNKDDEISTEEIEKAVASLKKLDKNNDGKISMDELTPDFSAMRGRGPGGPDRGRGMDRGGRRGPGGPERGGPERPRRPGFDEEDGGR